MNRSFLSYFLLKFVWLLSNVNSLQWAFKSFGPTLRVLLSLSPLQRSQQCIRKIKFFFQNSPSVLTMNTFWKFVIEHLKLTTQRIGLQSKSGTLIVSPTETSVLQLDFMESFSNRIMNFDDINKLSCQQSGLKHAKIFMGENKQKALSNFIYEWILNRLTILPSLVSDCDCECQGSEDRGLWVRLGLSIITLPTSVRYKG